MPMDWKVQYLNRTVNEWTLNTSKWSMILLSKMPECQCKIKHPDKFQYEFSVSKWDAPNTKNRTSLYAGLHLLAWFSYMSSASTCIIHPQLIRFNHCYSHACYFHLASFVSYSCTIRLAKYNHRNFTFRFIIILSEIKKHGIHEAETRPLVASRIKLWRKYLAALINIQSGVLFSIQSNSIQSNCIVMFLCACVSKVVGAMSSTDTRQVPSDASGSI